jgi:hypothetical protein
MSTETGRNRATIWVHRGLFSASIGYALALAYLLYSRTTNNTSALRMMVHTDNWIVYHFHMHGLMPQELLFVVIVAVGWWTICFWHLIRWIALLSPAVLLFLFPAAGFASLIASEKHHIGGWPRLN